MKRKIIETQDGSVTIHIEDWDESYHSKHGAIQEAYHVFIKHGLDSFSNGSQINILEIGFGTGLNTLITSLEKEKRNLKINYVGVEAYPVKSEEVQLLNYPEQLNHKLALQNFEMIHQSNWEEKVIINEDFYLTKRKQFFHEITDVNQYDLIYFDAFGYRVQPELWSEEIFKKMYQALKPKGILVTYACRSVIKKAMQSVGFKTEKLPGAPGKREMLRAIKDIN